MSDRLNPDQIREYWHVQAREHGQSTAASWSDRMVIEMEARELLERIEDGDRVLDVGCGNGYSTVQLCSQKRIRARGVDYVPEMIEQARSRLREMGGTLLGSVEFDVGDVSALGEKSETYDKVISTRVIINLGDWSRQLQGLRECVRVLKRGGTLLLSEATLQGWRKLNDFRREWQLAEIPIPSFNNYLDRDVVVETLSGELQLVEVVNFASTYYVGTRVLKPLLIQALGAQIDVADPNMEWNRWFAQLPVCGDYGTQELFVFEKL